MNKESFYHSFLTKLFSRYQVESNRESGDGRFDLCILPADGSNDTVVIIECKHSADANQLMNDATQATKQIVEKNYRQDMLNQGYSHIVEYGISFYKKGCYVEKVK